jgi:hypothetical protein
MGLRERSAQNSEVLREHIDQAPVDGAITGHHTIAQEFLFVQTEIGASVRDQLPDLLKTALIEQQMDTFAGGKLALLMLCSDPFGTAPFQGLCNAGVERVEMIIHERWALSRRRRS